MPRSTGPGRAEPSEARKTLAANLAAIFEKSGLNSTKLEARAGISQRAIHDMLLLAHDPQLGRVDKVAAALGLKCWQLIHSPADAQTLEVLAVYNQASDEGRRLIYLAVRSAKEELERRARGGNQSRADSWPEPV